MFGEACADEFLFRPGLINLNHASYGSTPRCVVESRERLQRQVELCPDDWFRRSVESQWMGSLQELATFLAVNSKDIVFVNNTTQGVNTVLNSVVFTPGQGILICDLAYNAVINTVKAVAQRKDLKLHVVKVTFPIASVEEVVEKFRICLEENADIQVAVIDHITSATALQMPVEALVSLCKVRGVLTLVDGAHAAGQVANLRVAEIGADYYTGSLHKWLYTAKGCGFLYCSPQHQATLYPLTTSHNHFKGLQERFLIQGTRDETSYLTVGPAIAFIERMGGIMSIHNYIKTLLDEACELLVDMWQTEELRVPDEMRAPYLRMVQVPDIPGYSVERCEMSCVDLLTTIYRRHNMVVVILPVQGKMYVRLAGQIFNTLDHYRRLGEIILNMARGDGSGSDGVGGGGGNGSGSGNCDMYYPQTNETVQ